MRLTAILLSIALLSAFPDITAAQDYRDPSPEESASASGEIGGHFILVDQDGKTVLDENYRGRFLLITFGYTRCPDVCPTTLLGMARALAKLGPEGAKVLPIFITLDPSRDTPAVLKDYMLSFGPRFVGLGGPEPYVADVARKFRIKYTKVESATLGYTIDHTAGIFLLAPDGGFIERFSHDISGEALAARLRERLAAEAN